MYENTYKPGEYIVCDLKHMPKSIDGQEYLCTFTDVSTRLSEPFYFHTKLSTEFLIVYKGYCKYIRNKTGSYPKYIHTDNGTEFVNKVTSDFNKDKGITHTTTSPHSSLQNPIAERINRTIGEGSLALLLFANLPVSFWIYSVAFFVFVKVRSPHKSLNLSNPISSWNVYNTHRTHVDLYDIRTFGCEAYVLDENSLKNSPKAFRCIYLGPCSTQKGSSFYNLYTKKVIVSRNFVVNEQCYPGRVYFPHIYDKYFGPTPPTSFTQTINPTTVNVNSESIPFSDYFDYVPTVQSPSNTSISSPTSTATTTTNTTTTSTTTTSTTNTMTTSILSDYYVSSTTPTPPTPTATVPAAPNATIPTPISTTSPNYVDVNDNLQAFNRNVFSKEGYADMPPLENPSADEKSEEKTTTEDAIPEEGQFEVEAIIGRRATKFGKKKNTRFKHSGGIYDYQVKWSTGETTFEPETTLRESVPEMCDDYDESLQRSQHPSTAPNFQDVPTETTSTESSSFSFVNLCNFVHVKFFCHLAKLITASTPSWKNIKVPTTRNEMLRSPEKELWLAAERKELDQIIAKDTFKRIKRPKKKPISCRWIYKLKPPTTLQPEPIFKARLVAHGYKQKANIDYSSTFAQVATLKAFRIMMWLAVFLGYRATQMDVKNAFLAGKLDKEIYMTAPEGYEQEIGCVLLLKSLYGLKQAPRIWYHTLVSELHRLGFKETISDSCIFRHTTHNCFLLVFVDDIIMFTNDESFRTQIEKGLKSKFDIKIFGTLKYFIGIQIDTDEAGNVHLHQYDYIQKLKDSFYRYFTAASSKITAPCDPTVKFSVKQQPHTDKEKHSMKHFPYRTLIGSLLYLLGTRPELYFIIISLSRFVQNPGYIHWLAALRVLFYVTNTSLFGILIYINQTLRLSVYVDSDHGSDVDDRKSISGYIIYLGNTPIIWRSKKQKGKPADSSCEAEYISMSSCINEIVWVISFMSELGFQIPTPVPIYCDNTSANALAHNPVHHERTKHIDIKYHRIREFILDGTVSIHYVKSEDNPADIFTKPVTVSVFKKLICIVYGKFLT